MSKNILFKGIEMNELLIAFCIATGLALASVRPLYPLHHPKNSVWPHTEIRKDGSVWTLICFLISAVCLTLLLMSNNFPTVDWITLATTYFGIVAISPIIVWHILCYRHRDMVQSLINYGCVESGIKPINIVSIRTLNINRAYRCISRLEDSEIFSLTCFDGRKVKGKIFCPPHADHYREDSLDNKRNTKYPKIDLYPQFSPDESHLLAFTWLDTLHKNDISVEFNITLRKSLALNPSKFKMAIITASIAWPVYLIRFILSKGPYRVYRKLMEVIKAELLHYSTRTL